MKTKAKITGLGSYLPQKILSNFDLEKMVDTSDEWIISRTGIKERRIADEVETPSEMGALASKSALKNAGLDLSEIDLILAATMTPEHYGCPSTAALIQSKLGCLGIPAFDVQAACSGYLYALSVAKVFVESGQYRNVLVAATEKMSSIVDFTDRSTCVLFGDGASAFVVSIEGKGLEIGQVLLGGDGSCADLIEVPNNSSKAHINLKGREVFKHAVRRMAQSIDQNLGESGLKKEDISWLIPHQANGRIIDALERHMGIPKEKVFVNLEKYGNTSASSVGIALDELLQQHPTSSGDRYLLVAFGAGLTWGSALLTQN